MWLEQYSGMYLDGSTKSLDFVWFGKNGCFMFNSAVLVWRYIGKSPSTFSFVFRVACCASPTPYTKPPQVAVTYVFCVLGVYVISLSCAVGCFNGSPSVLHRIACDRTVPLLNFLSIDIQVKIVYSYVPRYFHVRTRTVYKIMLALDVFVALLVWFFLCYLYLIVDWFYFV